VCLQADRRAGKQQTTRQTDRHASGVRRRATVADIMITESRASKSKSEHKSRARKLMSASGNIKTAQNVYDGRSRRKDIRTNMDEKWSSSKIRYRRRFKILHRRD
jgi:hypothetical protein